MCHGLLLLFLRKSEFKFFTFPKYSSIVSIKLQQKQLLIYTNECKVFATEKISLSDFDFSREFLIREVHKFQPMHFDDDYVAIHKETEFLSSIIASIPAFEQKSFEFVNSCFYSYRLHAVQGKDICYWLLSNVSAKGFDDFFVVTSCDVSFIPSILADVPTQIGLSTISKLAFLAEKDANLLASMHVFPKVAYLLAHMMNKKQEKLRIAQKLLSKPIPKEQQSLFDVCTYSGELLKSPFTLFCAACDAKYKLELKEFISSCILCGFPTWKSKFCA
jgi:hypothetical protein